MESIEYLDFDAGELEIRGKGTVIAGAFPYGKYAVVKDRGVNRKETITGNAFSWQLARFRQAQAALEEDISNMLQEHFAQEIERANVHVLVGHSFAQQLGSLLGKAYRLYLPPVDPNRPVTPYKPIVAQAIEQELPEM